MEIYLAKRRLLETDENADTKITFARDGVIISIETYNETSCEMVPVRMTDWRMDKSTERLIEICQGHVDSYIETKKITREWDGIDSHKLWRRFV